MARMTRHLAVCLKNDGYEVSLETRKIYVVIPDDAAQKHGLVRAIDESGEDYLYPTRCFAKVELRPAVGWAVKGS